MTNPIYDACNRSIKQLGEIDSKCAKEIIQISETLNNISCISSPSNNSLNYVLPIFYGALGSYISSAEKINEFLRTVHDEKAKKNGIIGTLLGHDGDNIDTVMQPDGGRVFINRIGERSEIGAHRLLWGHDIFSTSITGDLADNPFVVLTKQHGLIKGVFRVFQHLIADTFSKQGLPIPFHSHFDVLRDGKIENRLLNFAKKTAEDVGGLSKYQAFNNMFTIKASDIGATGLTWGMCAVHNRILNPDDLSSHALVKAIAFSAQFFSKAAYGIAKTGVPFISWPTALMATKEIYTLYRLSWKEISRLEDITRAILEENKKIELFVFDSGKYLPSHKTACDYINELHGFDRRMNSAMDFYNNL